jgi:hypothetical protein
LCIVKEKNMLKKYLDMKYFGESCSNIYSHNNILQHPFGSNLIFFQLSNEIFLRYFENISKLTINQASGFGSYCLVCTRNVIL